MRKPPQPAGSPPRYYIVASDGRRLPGTDYYASFKAAKAAILAFAEKGGHTGARETYLYIRKDSSIDHIVAAVLLRGDHDWDKTVAAIESATETDGVMGEVAEEPRGEPDYNAVSDRERHLAAWEEKRRLS